MVSVVVPAHVTSIESRKLLDVELDALAGQDHSGSFEVIVADNDSPVGLREHIEGHSLRDRLNLRYVDASGARGAAHARNVGAEQASGEILLFCDHDDWVYPEWMRRLIAFLETGYDLVSSAVEGRTLNRHNPRKVAEVPPPESFQPAGVAVPVVVAGSMACRAEVYRKTGGLDETYPANEDVEFGWRVHRQGYRVGYLPAALVAYRYRRGFRAGLRQGRPRGRGLARLHADYPGNGLPEIHLPILLRDLMGLTVARGLTGEERGLLMGILLGQLTGGLRHRTLHWR
ncbi:glycosyltransferase family 2 protein [Nocardia sp. BMG51109]|uniref:glycosyltransferase n=1 Tax=Nocardia sp. BMG51109 TaxID=1056816 RepID=UPI0004659D4E|nr:glycosyltransferase family 2 protein [Nocardia sp. BMG51109]